MGDSTGYTKEELEEEFRKIWLALSACLGDGKQQKEPVSGSLRLLISIGTVIAALGALFGPALAVIVEGGS